MQESLSGLISLRVKESQCSADELHLHTYTEM